ncbi:hypothetical protein G5C51_29325 [Streptomyces sp. A7024]|uniref:SCP2 domain-containing protein n=1 Tax=Streptomyces coryli TaxID=1128680 RepID=A0A6G4U9D3_9ACTN|nr:hypothetical protein [Streptomyces coryli]NGN67988.1 hypothetical protein [Streptomyces coryli]
MTLHTDAERSRALYRGAFAAALDDAAFVTVLKEADLRLHFVLADPGYELSLGPDGVHDRPTPGPALRLELSAATLHEILLGRLPVPRAVVTRRLAVKGPVTRLRLLGDLLPFLGREYARLALPTAH